MIEGRLRVDMRWVRVDAECKVVLRCGVSKVCRSACLGPASLGRLQVSLTVLGTPEQLEIRVQVLKSLSLYSHLF